jgi:hypothetical protein
MSTAILNAFVTLLAENPEIIPDRDDLQLQLSQSYEDVDELAEMVGEYCKAHPDLHAQVKSLLKGDKEKFPGKCDTLSPPPLQVADYKYTILNTMHRVVATATPAPSAKT